MAFIDNVLAKLSRIGGIVNNSQLPRPQGDGFDVSKFRANVLGNTGLMRPTLFLCRITLPPFLFNGIPNNPEGQTRTGIRARDLVLYTEAVPLPGVIIANDDTFRRHGYGEVEKMPHSAIFQDTTFNFLLDGRGEILRLFHTWMKKIVDFGGRDQNSSFQLSYKEEYECTMEVIVFDEAENKLITYKFFNAYPFLLQEAQMNWNDSDQIMRLPVNFTYTQWTTNDLEFAQIEDSGNPTLSIAQKILKGVSAVKILRGMKKPRNVADVINVVNNAKIITGSIFGG